MTVLLSSRYELHSVLGHGGMATVYRATDSVSGDLVAVKVFHPAVELAGADVRRRREVALLEALDHPNLVRIVDADLRGPGHQPFLVTELVEGRTLAAELKQGPLPQEHVAQMGAALAGALAYIHSRGIVHRDLKPANVLLPVAADGSPLYAQPKLADFGIAVAVDSTRMTTEGFTVGTANYLSPEQANGTGVGPSCDIYSLGLVLLEAITGTLAFPGHGVEAAVARLSRDPVIPSFVCEALAVALARMLDRAPNRRPSAAQASSMLAASVGGSSLTSELLLLADPATRPEQTLQAPPRRRFRGAAVAAVVAGAIVGASVFTYTLKDETDAVSPTPTVTKVGTGTGAASTPSPSALSPSAAGPASTQPSSAPADSVIVIAQTDSPVNGPASATDASATGGDSTDGNTTDTGTTDNSNAGNGNPTPKGQAKKTKAKTK
jgi:serine/threonine protein kinase